MTFLMFPLPTFDLQTHRTTRVVYLKETFFFFNPFQRRKKESVALCQIHMYDKLILCVYKAFFICVYLLQPQSGRLKMNFPY